MTKGEHSTQTRPDEHLSCEFLQQLHNTDPCNGNQKLHQKIAVCAKTHETLDPLCVAVA